MIWYTFRSYRSRNFKRPRRRRRSAMRQSLHRFICGVCSHCSHEKSCHIAVVPERHRSLASPAIHVIIPIFPATSSQAVTLLTSLTCRFKALMRRRRASRGLTSESSMYAPCSR